MLNSQARNLGLIDEHDDVVVPVQARVLDCPPPYVDEEPLPLFPHSLVLRLGHSMLFRFRLEERHAGAPFADRHNASLLGRLPRDVLARDRKHSVDMHDFM